MKNSKLFLIGGATLFLATIGLISSYAGTPKRKPVVVQNFDPKRYVGKWYEIARFDFFFEKNIDNTTATYTLNDDQTIKVVNRGFNYKKNKWSEAVGKAKFVSSPNEGKLKVSFFGPFYSAYNIVELDPEYRYALIVGRNKNYIWFLSRTPSMPEEVKQKYVDIAESLGYDLSRLVWVEHGNRD